MGLAAIRGRPLEQCVVIEVFAGTCRVTACLRQLGCKSSFGTDKVRHKNLSGPVIVADLTCSAGRSLFMKWISNENVVGIFLAPPCGTASRARNIKLKHNASKKRKLSLREPQPLRSNKHPNGLPHLSWLDKLKVSQANKLYHLTSQIVDLALKRNLVVCVENPQFSFFWSTTFWLEVSSRMQYTIHHACQYGSKRLKKTMLAHNHAAFRQICLTCPGTSSKHRHEPWGLQEGKFATSLETAYPFALAKCIAHAFVVAFYENGAVPPPSTLAEVTSSSLQILQTVRSQTGIQPKASRIPPIVADWKTHVIAVGPAALLPNIQTNQKLEKLHQFHPQVVCPLRVLPSQSKLLSVKMGVDLVKGGDRTVTTPDSSIASSTSNVKLDSQRWAIPWDPIEFIAEAHKAGHPVSLKSIIPDELHETLDYYKCTPLAKRIDDRAKAARYWLGRATELSDEERKLRSKMDPCVAAVLQGKRLALWKEMLESCNYKDLDVFQEFISGTALTGEIKPSGLWPHKFSPAIITESSLHQISEEYRELVQTQAIVSQDESVNRSVWDQTIQEVALGYVEGPFELDTIPKHFPISRRFGVKQGAKVRCVDDFTGSSVNSSIESHESPRPHTLDLVGGLLSQCMQVDPNGGQWLGRVFDLKAAYRQCAVAPSSRAFSYIGVYHPEDGRVKAFRMLALPFGSISAVHAFLRFSASIWFLGTRIFRILWSNYFDDFVTTCQEAEASSVTNAVHCLFTLLGWRYADSGSKAPPFSPCFQALGVVIDLENLHKGIIKFDNTPSRKEELSNSIRAALDSGKLAHRDALRLRGRMQFTTGQIFGRISRTCLSLVTEHAYARVGTLLSSRTREALTVYLDSLCSQEPRELTRASSRTWIMLTDASFEPGESGDVSAVGGVLVDPNGKPVKFFSKRLTQSQLDVLNPNHSKTVIFQLEFLAVLCGFVLWNKEFANSQLLAFIDNNGVRDALIACQTTNQVGLALLRSILNFESSSRIIQWYSRVPSVSNIADEPSRMSVDRLKKLSGQESDLDVQSVIQSLGLS